MQFPYNCDTIAADLKHKHGEKYTIINLSEIPYNKEQSEVFKNKF